MIVNKHIHQTTNMMYWLRNSSKTLRFASSIVLITFNMLILSPVVHAVQDNPIQSIESTNPEADLSSAFEQLINQLDALKQARQDNKDTTAILTTLKELSDKVTSLDVAVMDNFHKLEADLKAKQLPAVIMQRHTDMVMHYQAQRDAWMQQLESEMGTGFFTGLIRSAKDLMGVTPITEKVISPLNPKDPRQFKRKQQPFDPNEVTDRSLKPNPDNMPKVNKAEFTQAGLHNTPHTKLAALGDFTFDQLAGASDPVYLAATDEITLSQAIKDKAAELNFDPIKIHHFVRNNIEWVPSWGAIQNADLTLSAQRGNAMDISSLTLALLRASQIPARYVHGTIDVPRDRFLNWAGGFTDTNAAITFAASAGIPTTAVFRGGEISEVRIEHVWVEAAIDYFPSRGAKNRDADSWVQFDPSYKQYEYLEGLDSVAISGGNYEQLAQNFIDSGIDNEVEGWVSTVNPRILEESAVQTQQTVADYIDINLINPVVKDVIGQRIAITKEYPILPSSLPNSIVVEGARYSKLPSSLQQTIGWAFDRDIIGKAINIVSFPMAKVNNEKVTLSFKPATADDDAVLKSLLPEGGITDISQIPNNIPSHLISVLPELKINGFVVKTGTAIRLGDELDFVTSVKLAHQSLPDRSYNVIAGSFLSVNAIAQSISPNKLRVIQKKVQQTSEILSSNDITKIKALTKEDTLGDMFYVGSLAYYAQFTEFGEISGLQNQARFHLAAGIGTVGYEPNVDYFFGFPRSIQQGGVVLDIPFTQVTQTLMGEAEKLKDFNFNIGILSSSLEHITPEQMLNIESPKQLDAISTVKALIKANTLGQRIYQITTANIDAVLPNLRHDTDTLNEIKASINAGKKVITHTDTVSIPGFTGFGYAILDQQTNVGAWKISGGTNGGETNDFTDNVLLFGEILFETVAGLADSGAEIPRYFAKLFGYVGLMLELVTTFVQCKDTAPIRAIISAIILFAVVAGIVAAFVAVSVVNPVLTAVAATILGAHLSTTLLETMRNNLCR